PAARAGAARTVRQRRAGRRDQRPPDSRGTGRADRLFARSRHQPDDRTAPAGTRGLQTRQRVSAPAGTREIPRRGEFTGMIFMKPWILLLIIVAGLVLLSVSVSKQGGASALAVESESLPAAPGNGQRAPVIVELFTSEGCSSCPPADAVLAKLERQQPVAGAEVIALGEHVDYWNYIGWSDPFSSHLYSEWQRDYARAFNRDGVYTPQMVVDGEAEFIGSNLGKAREAIDVMLAITESDLSSSVLRGENAGRKLDHGSVVRQIALITQAESREAKTISSEPIIRLPRDWKRENLRAVAFAQAHNSRRVLGAAAIKLQDGQGNK